MESITDPDEDVSVGFALLMIPVALMWVLEVIDRLTGWELDSWGIRPRSFGGLVGIVCSPFLHGDFSHLLANTLPLLILGGVIMMSSPRTFVTVTLNVILLGGLGVWLIGGRNEIHIGASGLVFGYFGFLIMRGYFERSLSSLLIAALVIVFYGSLIWGVFPIQRGVSWEGHLMGFLAGTLAAWSLAADKWRGRRIA